MSKQFEAVMVEAEAREDFIKLKEQTELTNTELLRQMMNKYQGINI